MPLILYVFLSAVVFTGLILFLVAILSFIESKVVRRGNCKIYINDSPEPVLVTGGKSLLFTLGSNKVFLPAACGGSGTCATCKCQVLEGGGNILPTETGQISRWEQKNHFRLACQVKVRNDLKIRIPDEAFHIKQFPCVVRSNRNVSTFIKELILELPKEQSVDFKAGGYIQIDIPPYKIQYKDFQIEKQFHPDWDKYKLWDLVAENTEPVFRAYSMANYPGEKGIIMLNVRIATPPPTSASIPPGIATSYMFGLKPGDKATISGPYGEFFIKDTEREMIYIGGGAGMAPLRSHILHLFHTLKTERKVSYWYGARSLREMFYEEEFRKIEKSFSNFSFHIALSAPLKEDNWKGPTGFIHQVVYDNYLKNHEEPDEAEYYLCGPPVMIDAVQGMLNDLGVPPEIIAFDKFG